MATQHNAGKNSGASQEGAETDDGSKIHLSSSRFVPVMFISAGSRCGQAKTAILQLEEC
jgi:hypothetical protein